MVPTLFSQRRRRRPGFLRAKTPPEPPSFSAFAPDPTLVDSQAGTALPLSAKNAVPACRGDESSLSVPTLLSSAKQQKAGIGPAVCDEYIGTPRRRSSRFLVIQSGPDTIKKPLNQNKEDTARNVAPRSAVLSTDGDSSSPSIAEIATALTGQTETHNSPAENVTPFLRSKDTIDRSQAEQPITKYKAQRIRCLSDGKSTLSELKLSTPVRKSLRLMTAREGQGKQEGSGRQCKTKTPERKLQLCNSTEVTVSTAVRQRSGTPSRVLVSMPKRQAIRKSKLENAAQDMNAIINGNYNSLNGTSAEKTRGSVYGGKNATKAAIKNVSTSSQQILPSLRSNAMRCFKAEKGSAMANTRSSLCANGLRNNSTINNSMSKLVAVQNPKPSAVASVGYHRHLENVTWPSNVINISITSMDHVKNCVMLTNNGCCPMKDEKRTEAQQIDKMQLLNHVHIDISKERSLSCRAPASDILTVCDDLLSGSIENPSYATFLKEICHRGPTNNPMNANRHSTRNTTQLNVDNCDRHPRVDQRENANRNVSGSVEAPMIPCLPAVVLTPAFADQPKGKEGKKRNRFKREMRTCFTQVTPVLKEKKKKDNQGKPVLQDMQTSTTDFSHIMYVPGYKSLCVQVDLDQTESLPKRRKISDVCGLVANRNCDNRVDMGKSALSSHLFVKMPDNDGTIRQALAPPPDIARNSIEATLYSRGAKKSLSVLVAEEQNLVNSKKLSSQFSLIGTEMAPPFANLNLDALPGIIVDNPGVPVSEEKDHYVPVNVESATQASTLPVFEADRKLSHVTRNRQATNAPSDSNSVNKSPAAVSLAANSCHLNRKRSPPLRPIRCFSAHLSGKMPVRTVNADVNALQKDLFQRPFIRRRVIISNEVFRRVNQRTEEMWEAFRKQFKLAAMAEENEQWTAHKAAKRRSEARRDALVDHEPIDDNMEEEIQIRVTEKVAQMQKKIKRIEKKLAKEAAAKSKPVDEPKASKKQATTTTDENSHTSQATDQPKNFRKTKQKREDALNLNKRRKITRATSLQDSTNHHENRRLKSHRLCTLMEEEISPIKITRLANANGKTR
ncbi:uncharacterized protein LOC111263415 isoform X2 [Varroa jacobsoni]|uniref:uncharacterized protein LOC111263415 isoform X2 n=1 Tax=Varroa jacobsoni TaxID=62625 RepID=UPI000BF727B3|nr:uncharacterized protein LOC111263415 isoform X2 [Varroa jacobsoni]